MQEPSGGYTHDCLLAEPLNCLGCTCTRQLSTSLESAKRMQNLRIQHVRGDQLGISDGLIDPHADGCLKQQFNERRSVNHDP